MQVSFLSDKEGMRLDLYLSQKTELSRAALQKLIEEGQVLVNEKKVKKNYKLSLGERIILSLPEEEKILPQEMNLEVLYEDGHLAVINKPPGLTVHPGSGQVQGTLVSGLLATGWPLSTLGGEERPGIVHRLDKETSGLLIIAKDDKAHAYLQEELQERKIKRSYLALVHGIPKWTETTVEGYLERHPRFPTEYRMSNQGRFSRSYFTLLETLEDLALLSCDLDTGRTHQLRVHLKSIHHPVLGDQVYGPKKTKYKLKYHCLHAYRLQFATPQGKKIDLTKEPPEEFLEILHKKGSESFF